VRAGLLLVGCLAAAGASCALAAGHSAACFETLPTEVWTATGVSACSEAAPAALALIVLAAPVVWLGVVRGGGGLSELQR